MTWMEIVKETPTHKLGKKRTIDYMGTCKKCNQYVKDGDECPLTLPAKTFEIPTASSCPMKVGR